MSMRRRLKSMLNLAPVRTGYAHINLVGRKQVGFAWPSGYGGSGFSKLGLPEFDWSILLYWNVFNKAWQPVEKFAGKQRLLFRAALPTRTKQHKQATFHTLWSPGSPNRPKEKV